MTKLIDVREKQILKLKEYTPIFEIQIGELNRDIKILNELFKKLKNRTINENEYTKLFAYKHEMSPTLKKTMAEGTVITYETLNKIRNIKNERIRGVPKERRHLKEEVTKFGELLSNLENLSKKMSLTVKEEDRKEIIQRMEHYQDQKIREYKKINNTLRIIKLQIKAFLIINKIIGHKKLTTQTPIINKIIGMYKLILKKLLIKKKINDYVYETKNKSLIKKYEDILIKTIKNNY